MTGRGGNKDVHGTNSKRLAEVWMDDYKRLYYQHRPELKDKDWYLDNIAKNKFVPDEDVQFYGWIKNENTGLCIDTLQRDEKETINLGVFSCQPGGSSAQFLSLANDGRLRREVTCATVNADTKHVVMPDCSHQTDKWTYDKETKLLRHERTGLCLDVDGVKGGDDVRVNSCDTQKNTQKWTFEKMGGN
ncbi:Ricin B-type lectin domain-containing protein [Aphelenchoides fujianensis]|nr:Ricin B-type lectin domain-containing protein [Aphelenchoides fujianensis]